MTSNPKGSQKVNPNVKWIGLTGGIASGKSHVADLLRKAGITVINLDLVGRELTNQTPEVANEMARICGPDVMKDGKLDRALIRERLFAEPELRRKAEAFLHPLIWREFEKKAAEAQARGERLVICEAALLMEAGLESRLDGVVLVTAPEDVRRDRVVARDNVTRALAEQMIRAQMNDLDRPQSSHFVVIENRGSIADLALKVTQLLDRWRAEGLLPKA